MKSGWLFAGLVALALLLAALATTQHPHEQTVFLERIADKIEHVRVVAPETDRAIRSAVQSIRRSWSRLDEPLQVRQRQAITRIETALASKTAAIVVKDGDRPRADLPARRVSGMPSMQ